MKLPEPLDKLKGIKHAKWIGLVMTIILNVLLMLGTLFLDPETGYYIMMVGLVAITFSVMYIFGWRDGKKLVVAGIGIFILMGLIWGPMTVHRTYSMEEPEPVSSAAHVQWFTKDYQVLNLSDYEAGGVNYAEDVGVYSFQGNVYAMDNGMLEPYKGEIGQGYNFTITVYSNATVDDVPTPQVTYALGIQGSLTTSFMVEVDPNDTQYADGKEFYYFETIDKEGIYSHVYSLRFQEGQDTHSLNTTVALGPLVGEETTSYGFYALIGVPSMFCNIGMLFIIIVLLYWWLGTAKEKRKTWDQALREKEDELEKDEEPEKDEDDGEEDDYKPFTCDQCGTGVGVDDNFCPKCGERFDEDESGDSEDESEPEGEGYHYGSQHPEGISDTDKGPEKDE